MTKNNICKIENCTHEVRVEKRGLCSVHYIAWQIENNPECSVEDCDRNSYAKGLCRRHYERVRKTGDPSKTLHDIKAAANPTKNCIDEGCDRLGTNRGRCYKHYVRWTWSDEGREQVKEYRLARKDGYVNAHGWVKRTKGMASGHKCVDCGKDATDWSLSHTADMKVEYRGAYAGSLYSMNTDDYEARCRNCHKAYDVEHNLRRQGNPENAVSTFRPTTQKTVDKAVGMLKSGYGVSETADILGIHVSAVSRYFRITEGIGYRDWKAQQKAGEAA